MGTSGKNTMLYKPIWFDLYLLNVRGSKLLSESLIYPIVDIYIISEVGLLPFRSTKES